MVYKRKRSYSRPGYGKRRKTIARTYRRRKMRKYPRYRKTIPALAKGQKNIVKIGQGFPKALLTKLPYRYNVPLTSGTGGGSSAWHVFRLNSPYDPDYTGTGISANDFDRYASASLFQRYLCYKVDICVTFRTAASTTDDCMAYVNVSPTVLGAPASAASLFQDGLYPNSHVKMLSRPDGDYTRWSFIRTYHMAYLFGVGKSKIYSEDDYSADYNGNPANPMYLNVAISDDPNDTSTAIKVDVEVYLRYHVKFYQSISI